MDKLKLGWIFLTCAALAAGTTGAFAQDLFSQEGQIIYSGRPIAQAGITIGGWGSGKCEESTLNTYGGSCSLKITPKDLYAGGRIDFTEPVDLTSQFNDPAAYLQLITRFGGVQATYDSWAVGLASPGATDIYGGTAKPGRQVKRVRVVIYLEGGESAECQADVSAFKLAEDGWMNVSFPTAALKGKLDLPAYKVKRLAVAGDGTEPFYIGEIRVIRDAKLLEADAGEEMEVAKNYPIVFHGYAQIGASAVKYSWDFDGSDGIQEQAVGDLLYHRFNNAGDYIVTFTVSDIFGLKRPATSTINVKVNE